MFFGVFEKCCEEQKALTGIFWKNKDANDFRIVSARKSVVFSNLRARTV
jgi:hypothetical protein